MNSLDNMNIALLEARMSDEMARLIRRHGGTPYSVPAVREAPLNSASEVNTFIDHLVQNKIQVIIFFTGVGVATLLKEAEALERLPEILDALCKVTIVCRGPKPAAVLKRHGIPIALNASEPHTTNELIQVLDTLDLQGLNVALVHYGERNAVLTQNLRDRGIASLEELCLYQWLLPEDLNPLRTLVRDIIEQHIDAVVFTSQIQARHLLHIAAEMQLADQLITALNTRTIVASIGPTCTAALQDYSITPHVVPKHPKMGHLVLALVAYVSSGARPSMRHT
ncbi:MAG: uroporphyrinogen-III synthase [Ktedonobacteraceae bacterium]|nr:uroporphyrinogen-III synthase [Ktedonobacteraceae bacterium]